LIRDGTVQYSGPEARNSTMAFSCPYCECAHPPIQKKKISSTGWMVFIIMLIFCFPLCIIGIFIKEEYRVCRDCGITLG
jgi:hypothetical protein